MAAAADGQKLNQYLPGAHAAGDVHKQPIKSNVAAHCTPSYQYVLYYEGSYLSMGTGMYSSPACLEIFRLVWSINTSTTTYTANIRF